VPERPLIDLDVAGEESELRAYLGGSYDPVRLQQYQRTLDEEFEACGDEDSFYRTSEGYLYNLTAFAMTGTKLPYLEELTRQVPPGSRVLDYGCGIGTDGLLLIKAGYRVEFADFDNPSVGYLRWRLEQRGIDAPVHDLDAGVPGGFDAAFAFDVIEHVADPFGFLGEMEQRARLVEVNFLEPESGEQELHHELPVRELIRHVMRHELLRYRILHRRSHLVLYRPEAAGSGARGLNLLRLAAARLRRMTERAGR
jgi:SAM-dependent methyltransferase